MPYSSQSVVSDGTLVLLDVSIKYFDRSEISVLFDDEVQVSGWSWVGTSESKLAFAPAVPTGTVVKVQRKTMADSALHLFDAGAAFTAGSMDENFEQIIRVAQEMQEGVYVGTDLYNNLDMHGSTLNNLADAVLAQQPVTYKQLLDVGYGAAELTEEYTATEGQTVFALTKPYTVGTGNLSVFINGVRQDKGTAYYETTSTLVTFTEGLAAGDYVQFFWAVAIASSGLTAVELREDLASSDPAKGAAMVGYKGRTQADKNGEWVSVLDYGADKTGATDSTAAFIAACAEVRSNGGGVIFIPAGTFNAQIPVASGVYWRGAGRGATVITQPDGANRDIAVSDNFAALTGVGPLTAGPMNFGIRDLTIDGNYLADYSLAASGGDTLVNNTSGYGVRIFGSKYCVDVEIVNCAEVGFYSEAYDYAGYGEEQDSVVRISGRVFGKEAFVFRGPADINIEHVMMGCAGWLPTQAARDSIIVNSYLFTGEPVHVMVSDEQVYGGKRYNGHHEFGFMHLYGNLNGLAYKSMDAGRIKGDHLVCENCRGGAYFSARSWGEISKLECHSNGREPAALAGTLATYPDIDVASTQGLTINATVRRSTLQAASYLALRSLGKHSVVKLNYFATAPTPSASPVAYLRSESGTYDITCVGVAGDAVTVEGIGNVVRVNGRGVASGSLVKRIAGASSQNRANSLHIAARDCANVLNCEGLVSAEKISITAELSAGQTVFSGTALDMVSRAITVDVSARIGTSSVASVDIGRVNLDNTVTTEQTITVTHNYFQAPDAAQVSFSAYDPSPTYGGGLQYLYLQSVSSSQLTFVYKLSATGTNGPLVLCWRIA